MPPFSRQTKEELAHLPFERDCCVKAEIAAMVHNAGSLVFGGGQLGLRVAQEQAVVARRLFTLVKRRYGIAPAIVAVERKRLHKAHRYELFVEDARRILEDLCLWDGENGLHEGIDASLVQTGCCRRAYARGVMLSGGSLSDPEKGYHLEFVWTSEAMAGDFCRLLNRWKLHARQVVRKGTYVVYLKEGGQIINLLGFMGASTAVLALENTRIWREVRNNVNRAVNCESANLDKTVAASSRQMQNIEYIRLHGGFAKLPPALRQVAEIRMNQPEASLKELGEMLSPAVGKSAVNHRLRRIDEIAEDLRIQEGQE